jgi:hypothetical protein
LTQEKNDVIRTSAIAVAVLIGTTLSACATDAEKTAAPKTPTVEEAVLASEILTVTAKVEAVDHARRLVTLRGPEGRTVTAKVDPAVRNFSKVKVGDTVTVGYRESIVLEIVRGGGAPSASAEVAAARAAPGEKPAGFVAERVRVTAKVSAIDTANRRVELAEPNGKVQSYPVRDPEVLKNLKVGDDVSVVYTEALAVLVEPAKKKR